MRTALEALDHLVVAVADLPEAIDRFEERLGVRAAIGGRHARWGTHNALLSLGPGRYLELVAEDPQAKRRPQPFGLEGEGLPRITAWMIAATLPQAAEEARRRGFDPGGCEAMERIRPDGGRVAWRLAIRLDRPGGGLVPAIIDWGDSPHPSGSAPAAGEIESLRLEHPEPAAVEGMLSAVGVAATVLPAPSPRIAATVRTRGGARIELD